ncbi:MAG: hypothetical protein GY820_48285 [Gammaproteobacteria bacterium]|nr:hypothetical protein [Gammaproteobacteria bacterium]
MAGGSRAGVNSTTKSQTEKMTKQPKKYQTTIASDLKGGRSSVESGSLV